jgi:phage terminase large subunit GpA-like protein
VTLWSRPRPPSTDAASAPDPAADDAPIWSDAERLAWSPPEAIDPPRWAEKYRWLTRRQSDKTGFWRNNNAPYLIGIMLMCVRHRIEVVTILKASQIGVSEAMRCVIGYWGHLEPDPLCSCSRTRRPARRSSAIGSSRCSRTRPCSPSSRPAAAGT